MAEKYLDGVAVGFYRGIGHKVQRIGPFSDVNFFIGRNNAGKSIVLNFLHGHLPFGKNEGRMELDGSSAEVFEGADKNQFIAGLRVGKNEVFSEILEKY